MHAVSNSALLNLTKSVTAVTSFMMELQQTVLVEYTPYCTSSADIEIAKICFTKVGVTLRMRSREWRSTIASTCCSGKLHKTLTAVKQEREHLFTNR